MTTHIIPAAANAPMLKYFESQVFNELYIDQESVANQLFGANSHQRLGLGIYADYLRCLRMTTQADLFADTSFGQPDSIASTASRLAQAGANNLLISDSTNSSKQSTPILLSEDAYTEKLAAAQTALAETNTTAIANLTGFSEYGLAGLQSRIEAAHSAGITKIVISNISSKDISIIGAIMVPNQEIGLALDNAKMTFGNTQRISPAFILDTYHPKQAAQKCTQATGSSYVLQLYMEN